MTSQLMMSQLTYLKAAESSEEIMKENDVTVDRQQRQNTRDRHQKQHGTRRPQPRPERAHTHEHTH